MKTYKGADTSSVNALSFLRTLLAELWFKATPPTIVVQWHDSLLSLWYCFHCHFLILVYGPRCWQRGAIPQKRHCRAASDVLCGIVLLKQQTQTLPLKTPSSYRPASERNVGWACGNLFFDNSNRFYSFADTTVISDFEIK